MRLFRNLKESRRAKLRAVILDLMAEIEIAGHSPETYRDLIQGVEDEDTELFTYPG